MSLDAYIWVTKRAPVPSPNSARLVLYALAEHANDRWCAWPSKQTIAGYLLGFTVDESRKTADPAYRKQVDSSYQTVKRALKVLKAGGWISMGDQSLVAHYPHTRRPNVWRLNLDYLRDELTDGGQHSTPGTTQTPGPVVTPGDNADRDGGQHRPTPGTMVTHPGYSSVPQTTHINPPEESKEGTGAVGGAVGPSAAPAVPHTDKPSPRTPAASVAGKPANERPAAPAGFEEFWETVKAGKAAIPVKGRGKRPDAVAAYRKAIDRGISPETIHAGIRSQIAELEQTGRQLENHVATWIRHSRWENHTGPAAAATSPQADENTVCYTDMPDDELSAAADPEIQRQITASLNSVSNLPTRHTAANF